VGAEQSDLRLSEVNDGKEAVELNKQLHEALERRHSFTQPQTASPGASTRYPQEIRPQLLAICFTC